ncbi:MAG: LuxR C-terminal-related transcriptional regulator [Thermomicrobiales bacterium]
MQHANRRTPVLTPKTVSHHVSAIYAKLGVETRTEAALAATRLGVVAS